VNFLRRATVTRVTRDVVVAVRELVDGEFFDGNATA
jgi:hypothetical protein